MTLAHAGFPEVADPWKRIKGNRMENLFPDPVVQKRLLGENCREIIS
ncbi:MAG: hypothetical protein ABIK68_21940 [bacterium]